MRIDSLEAGRAIDALIAEKVFGLTVKKGCVIEGEEIGSRDRDLKNYSTDIADAWKILARFPRKRIDLEFLDRKPGFQWACVIDGLGMVNRPMFIGYGDTAPLTICRAALKCIETATPSPFPPTPPEG